MKSVSADLGIGEDGPPWIAFAQDAFPRKPGFVCVLPPGGGEEDARLFAVVSLSAPQIDVPVFHEGARPAAPEVFASVIDTVDPEAVPRLFERSGHPGDLTIEGRALDQWGRPETAVLSFMDLSNGLSSSDRLCTPEPMRAALAKAIDAVQGARWKAAANELDPGALMRAGVLNPLGGNPMTSQGFHEHMLERQGKTNADMNVSSHPQKDFRLLETDDIAAELEQNARAVLYAVGSGAEKHPVTNLMTVAVPRLAAAVRAAGDVLAAAADVRAALQSVAEGPELPVLANMMAGIGPGAVCWRDVFSETGLMATALRRCREPGCDDAVLQAVARLDPMMQKAFRDPALILISQPRAIDRVPARLRRRPDEWLALGPSRMAASPGMRTALSNLPDERLLALLYGNETLIASFRSIENSHPGVAEAHDALALGWRVLARAAVERGLCGDELANRTPEFLNPRVAALPWMGTIESTTQGMMRSI